MYKSFYDYQHSDLFRNYQLTDLVILKKNNRRVRISENPTLFKLLEEKLSQFGIILTRWYFNYKDGKLSFRAIKIRYDFPVENEDIFHLG